MAYGLFELEEITVISEGSIANSCTLNLTFSASEVACDLYKRDKDIVYK